MSLPGEPTAWRRLLPLRIFFYFHDPNKQDHALICFFFLLLDLSGKRYCFSGGKTGFTLFRLLFFFSQKKAGKIVPVAFSPFSGGI